MAEDPTRMHADMMRTMFSHAQCYNIFGKVFLQVKLAMAPYWEKPQSLQQACRKSIRRSLLNGNQRNVYPETVAELNLPKALQSYVSYQNPDLNNWIFASSSSPPPSTESFYPVDDRRFPSRSPPPQSLFKRASLRRRPPCCLSSAWRFAAKSERRVITIIPIE